MARSNTPGKKFNEIASQSYWGSESARKTVTAVPYRGVYIDINKTSLRNAIEAFLKTPEDFEVINGCKIKNNNKYYILHDRIATQKFHTGLASAGGNFKDESLSAISQLEFMQNFVSQDIFETIQSVYSSLENKSEYSLQKIYMGIYAFQNSYEVNKDVLFGTTFNELTIEESALAGWSFVLNVPVARSKVAGRNEHIELIKAKYLDDGLKSSDIVLNGNTKAALEGRNRIENTTNRLTKQQIVLKTLTSILDQEDIITFYKKED